MKALVIDTQAIRSNLSVVKEETRAAEIYGVLKGDAYGTGLVEAARLLREEGVGRFAVEEAADATALRDAGFLEEEILMLRSTQRQDELHQLMDAGSVCTIGSYEAGVALDALAKQRSTAAEAHICIDTGLGYGGIPAGEPDKILSVFRYLSHVAISGLYTRISVKKGDRREVSNQLDQLFFIAGRLREEGFDPGFLHASCSDPLCAYPFSQLDALQIGGPIFGHGGREGRNAGLRPVGYATAPIDEVHWLPAGQSAGAGSRVVLKKPAKIAVIPIGTYHGFCLGPQGEGGAFSALARWRRGRKPQIRISSSWVKMLGRPGMLETVVDVTRLSCSPGEPAVFPIDPRYARGLSREYR